MRGLVSPGAGYLALECTRDADAEAGVLGPGGGDTAHGVQSLVGVQAARHWLR